MKRFDLAGYRLKRSVYLILEDRKKRLWFGTDNGVIRWDGNEIREYNVHNGFVGREINRSAGIIDHSGRVWIGTDLGVSCYREEYDCDRNDIPPPLVKLTEIEVQGERRPYQNATHLGYSENNLVFHFECISFIDENAISFRAKLAGSDEEWIDGLDVGHQQMRYTHLKPGKYQFYVQAKNALGRWSPVITSPEIIISRPLWKQWWFHLTLLFVVALLTTSIYRFLTNKKLARNLEIKVRERTRQLQESEWRYRQMFESNQAVMLLINPKTGYVMDANPAACNFFGHSHANMLKLHFPMYQNESNDENIVSESFPIPEYIITQQRIASSKNRDVEIYACPIYLQGEKSVFLIIHDISERLQAEKALAAEKERLAVTLHSIADGVISTDIQGRVNLMNKVAENMTGWSLEKALGKKVGTVFKTVLENSRKPSENPVDNVLKSGRMQRFSSYNILKSHDDKERIIAASASPIHDRDKMLIGVVLVFRDVTKQRKLEEELLRASKIESVGVLAGGIAHDFNNILTGIIGNLSLVMMHIKKNESIYKLLSAAEKASYRARDLTQQLLTFSKGGVPIKKATRLAAIVEETAAFVLSGSNVHYEIRKPENLWQIMVDAGQINQVIHNLLLNAEQAMPSGGIIKITLENTIVQYNSSLPLKRGRYVKLIVDDSGIGISGGDLQKIFDPYFTTKQKGSGLGLATSYSIIKKHNGHIAVESRLGKGTTFCVYLPATSSEQVVEFNYEIDEMKEMRKVLLMDDDETIRSTTGKMLRYLGYQVETASNGEEAVQKYVISRKNGRAFDVAIFDLTVRGAMGGKEALQKLMKIDPGIKVIVSSGYSNDPIMANYEKYGFKGVVTKPYEISMLSKALKEVLTNHNE
ncbi:PAS domain S-box protein [candidate division KSB1 bacterium]|nr:PAS domain S-box protein [candidate division KSB1 bacterium]